MVPGGWIRQAAEDRKVLRESLEPFWVEEADDDTRQPRNDVSLCPRPAGSTAQVARWQRRPCVGNALLTSLALTALPWSCVVCVLKLPVPALLLVLS